MQEIVNGHGAQSVSNSRTLEKECAGVSWKIESAGVEYFTKVPVDDLSPKI